MPIFNEAARKAEHIIYDVPELSREEVTFTSGNVFVPGQVVKFTANKIVPAVAADTTGLFLCYGHVDASAADRKGVIHQRHAVVNGNLVVYPAGSTDPQKAAHRTALAAAQIIVR